MLRLKLSIRSCHCKELPFHKDPDGYLTSIKYINVVFQKHLHAILESRILYLSRYTRTAEHPGGRCTYDTIQRRNNGTMGKMNLQNCKDLCSPRPNQSLSNIQLRLPAIHSQYHSSVVLAVPMNVLRLLSYIQICHQYIVFIKDSYLNLQELCQHSRSLQCRFHSFVSITGIHPSGYLHIYFLTRHPICCKVLWIRIAFLASQTYELDGVPPISKWPKLKINYDDSMALVPQWGLPPPGLGHLLTVTKVLWQCTDKSIGLYQKVNRSFEGPFTDWNSIW